MFVLLIFSRKQINKTNIHQIPISIIIPAYNEYIQVTNTIESIIENNYSDLEIIIVDDGLEDIVTQYLMNHYSLKLLSKQNELCIYITYINEIPVYLINKIHLCKADAINIGIRYAHYGYVLMMDADTYLCEDALVNIVSSIDEDTIAVGGRIQVDLNHTSNLIDYLLTLFQGYEYDMNFLMSRIAYSNVNALPILSGAFTLAKKSILEEVNGLSTDTLGEDFDLTLKLQEYAYRDHKRIAYTSKAVCITEVPFTIKNWYKQRIRWHRGYLEVMHVHLNLLLHINRLSIVLLLLYLYETIFVFYEVTGLIHHCILTIYIGLIQVVTTLAICIYIRKEYQLSKLMQLVLLIPMFMLYHYMNVLSKLIATFIYLFTRNQNHKHWGIQERKRR